MTFLRTIAASAALSIGLGAASASASPLYAVGSTTDTLVEIDTTTGATTNIGGPIAAITGYQGGLSSYDGNTGTLSFVAYAWGTKLFSVDTSTGSALSQPAISGSFSNPEYNPSGTRSAQHFANHMLHSIDPTTAAATPVGSPVANINGFSQGSATVDGNTGTYTAQIRISSVWKLLSVDSSTGAVLYSPDFSQFFTGARYDGAGNLFAVNYSTDEFVSVDPTDGSTTVLGTITGLTAVSQGMATMDLDTGVYTFIGRLSSDNLYHLISIDSSDGSIISAPVISTNLFYLEYGYSADSAALSPGALLLFAPAAFGLLRLRRRRRE